MWCRKRRWNEPLSRLWRQLPFQGSLWWAVIVVSPNRGDAPQGAEGFHSVRRTPILFFRQYRIIRQGDLARNFSSQICCENAGILCVFQVFTADLWGKRTVKARRRNCAVLPLFFLLYSFSFAPTGGLTLPQNTTPLPPPSPPRPLSAAPFSAQTPSGCPQKCCRPM